RVHAEEGDVQRDLLQHARGERPDQLVGLRPGHPAGHDDLHVLPDGQLGGDVERVGDDREAGLQRRLRGERAGQLGGGGAAVEPDHLAGTYQLGRRGGDAVLLVGVPGRLVAQRQVVADALGDRAPARTHEHLLLGELVEVTADGRGGDVERAGRVFDGEPAFAREQLEDRVPAVVAGHDRPPFGDPSRGQAWHTVRRRSYHCPNLHLYAIKTA